MGRLKDAIIKNINILNHSDRRMIKDSYRDKLTEYQTAIQKSQELEAFFNEKSSEIDALIKSKGGKLSDSALSEISEWESGYLERIKSANEDVKKSYDDLHMVEELMIEKADKSDEKVAKVMREFKEGNLTSGSGKKVTDRDQAIAIALSEADKEKGAIATSYFDKSEQADQKNVFAVGILRNEEGKILFLRRSKSSSIGPDTWSLPGGHVEVGEHPSDAVIREFKEETGINIESSTPIDSVVHPNGGKTHYFCVTEKNPRENPIHLTDGENTNYEWMSTSDWMSEPLILDLKEILSKIIMPSINYDAMSIAKKVIEMVDPMYYDKFLNRIGKLP